MELLVLIFIALSLLLLGVPVAFSFGASGLFVGSYLMLFGDESFSLLLTFLPNRIIGIMENQTLISVPLFILMGMILEKSGIAERLIISISKLFGALGGGVAIGVIGVGVLLAASTGIVGATVVMMGVIAVPAMLKAGYDKRLASGVVAASGTLGQIVPPSVILIVLGDVLSVNVKDLFAAAVLPSAILVALFMLLVMFVAIFFPHLAPSQKDDSLNKKQLALEVLKTAMPPIVLILLVLGSIFTGFVEPIEAASVGVFGALILAGINKSLNYDLLKYAGIQTIIFCGMLFAILIGANCFTLLFNELGGDKIVLDFFATYLNSPTYFILVAMAVIFILGFFIDFFEICYIVLPILAGIAAHFGVDMTWFALLVAINLQTSFLTPPFGFSVFFLKSAVANLISIKDIYKGVLPFIILQLICLAIFFAFPSLTLNSDAWSKILSW